MARRSESGTLPPVNGFATLPFDEQLALVARAAREPGAAEALLREAGALPDSEPLARLVDALAEAGRVDEALRATLAEVLERLPDPALQQLLEEPGAAATPLLEGIAFDALRTWPITRPSALAFLVRWLRRRDPAAHARLMEEAEAATDGPPTEGRWLLFVSGARLAALKEDPGWGPRVVETVRLAVDALARAPKSISQANAETLLARRVYADPGHFLFELLQNADDAGATEWSARVEADRAVIANDGAPFSFLDLVGVLSIGLTTKAAQQIGFFGVGFKSVYEVCERPRIHSGAFDVEIAHVSIPRVLAARPNDMDAGSTALVLPFSDAVDADALFRRALAIPPETLLTLPHLERIELTGPDGARVRWRQRVARGLTVLSDQALTEGAPRRFRITERRVSFEGEREEGRARESRVLVALSVEDDGAPRPLSGPTLFAFLPTAERTGLRVLVHARFDVTVDRERVERGSAWNDALLDAAGHAIADAALELVSDGHDPLAILSAPDDAAPAVATLMAATRSRLHDAPCLPAADGSWISPTGARVVAPSLARALASLDLGDDPGSPARALAPLDPRELDVARWLGAQPLSDAALVERLGAHLEAGAPPPAWLAGPGRAAILEALADAAVDDAALRALPLVLTADGKLVRAADARVASTELAALYAGLDADRPVVAHGSVDALPERLRARLAIAAFDPARLVDDMQRDMRSQLLEREAPLLSALGALETTALDRLRDVPILRDSTGARRALKEGLVDLAPWLDALAPSLAQLVPVLDPELRRTHPALVARWVPAFGLDELADALDAGLRLNPEPARQLASLLDARATELSRGLARRLAAHPLFDDTHGALRPLRGEGRALIAGDASLREAVPAWPWLADPARPFVAAVEPPRVDAAFVASALAGALTQSVPTDALAPVYAWLATRADALTTAQLDALAVAPAFLDRDGVARPLSALRRGEASAAVDAYYDAAGGRWIAHPATLRLVDALRFGDRLPTSDHAALVSDLVREGEAPPIDATLVTAVLTEAAERLPASALRPLRGVRLFLDETGAARTLGSWEDANPEAAHRPGPFRAALRAGTLPLLAEAEEIRLHGLLTAIGPAPATAHDLARRADELLGDRDALLAALASDPGALDDEDRRALSALPLLESRSGTRQPALALVDPAPFERALGADRLEALGLGERWLSDASRQSAGAIGLTTGDGAHLLEENVLPALRPGAVLVEQPAPWRAVEDLWALRALLHELGVPTDDAPVCLDARGRLTRGPLWTTSDAAKRVAEGLPDDAPLRDRLADPAWAEGVNDAALLSELPARKLAEALRDACPQERPRDGHPVITDVPALLAWLREAADELRADEAAKAALGSAAILPSQRRTLRAPRDLVLDPSLPDLGLDWGLAPEVPPDVAGWLAETYELDLRARRTIVDGVLDGIDAAAEADDPARAAELVRFLARTLGAPQLDDATLEQRARRSKTRARLKVPLEGGAWDKPRFAWAPSDDAAEHAEAFVADLPPRIALPGLDAPARRLLAACGARADLDEDTVAALLDGDGIRDGAAARRALARYVALRALAVPARVETWRLRRRAWVPDREGALREPGALLWPDTLAEALFGDEPARFPDPQVTFDLPDEAADRLGFGRAASLSLSELARHVGDSEASPALLDWLEEGLRADRLSVVEVRRALRGRIRVRDDVGIPRPPRELARTDAARLFGRWRGDLALASELPRLARALEIPDAPHAPMILAFVEEMGAALPALSDEEKAELSRRLPECYERLGEEAEAGKQVPLASGSAVAAMSSGRAVVTTIGEPALRMLEPPGLAETLSDATSDATLDPLPGFDRSPTLARVLWAAGVPDLLTVFAIEAVTPGPERADLAAEADALHAALGAVLGDAVGARARVVDGLVARGKLELNVPGDTAQGDYRSASRSDVQTELAAAVHEGTLWLTPEALRAPVLIAPALARDPERRAATARWLEAGDWARAPKRVTRAVEPEAEPKKASLWERIGRVFSGEARERPSKPKRRERDASAKTGEGFFRPQAEVESQLERTDGWLEDRRVAPDFGFAFTPPRLPAPWLYAPKLVATRFDARGQRWRSAAVHRPEPRGDAGQLSMRGRLPKGDALIPVPLYGRLDEVRVEGGDATTVAGPSGGTVLRLERAGEVRLRMTLGAIPDLDAARTSSTPEALERFVPDDELPEEVLEFMADLDAADAPMVVALAIRDFVRARYRYDPSYLEDAAVGRWLAKITRGRAQAHVAALHAGGDARHLGAGVCYELNVLACELMRRAAIPAAIATGWVLDGGALSEPDHLWAIALLEDASGAPVWVPIDASTTATGRPLRVPTRPAGRFKPPSEKAARAPKTTKWDLDLGRGAGRGGSGGRPDRPRKTKRRAPPRAELRRLVRHLERVTKREVEPDELEALEAALSNPRDAKRLLERLLK